MNTRVIANAMSVFSSDFTKEELAELVSAAEKIKKRSWAVINRWADVSAIHFKTDREKIFNRCRKGVIYKARSIVMYYLHKEGVSYVKIGKLFGKDHATVLYNVKVCEKKLMKDYLFIKEKVETISDDVFEDYALLENHVTNPNVTFTFPNTKFISCPYRQLI